VFGRTKEVLRQHFDGNTGNRRNIFPYTQHINAAHVKADDDFKGH